MSNSSSVIKNIRVNKINNNYNPNENNINHIINRPENSQLSSMNNTTKKDYESNNNAKKPNVDKKPLSHSNSTKEIYSNNMERYLKIKQSQMMAQKKPSKNKNIYRQKKNSMGKKEMVHSKVIVCKSEYKTVLWDSRIKYQNFYLYF
jgi:hypothetical protein